MNAAAEISATLWIVWAIIGLIGGAMAGRLLVGGRLTLVLILTGILGALAGGWLMMSLGWMDPDRLEYVSLLSAAAATALILWPVVIIARRRK